MSEQTPPPVSAQESIKKWDAAVSGALRFQSRMRPWLGELMSSGQALRAIIAVRRHRSSRVDYLIERLEMVAQLSVPSFAKLLRQAATIIEQQAQRIATLEQELEQRKRDTYHPTGSYPLGYKDDGF